MTYQVFEQSIDTLNQKTAHLAAMLTAVVGGGNEHFSSMNQELQHDYLWACSKMASEIKELANQL